MRQIIGVDLGGTNIKTALIGLDGKIIKKYETSTQPGNGTKAVIEKIIFSIKKVKSGKIAGIGIGTPGPLDYKTGTILNPVNLPFRNVPLRKIIQNKFGIKTLLDNDANCFALAEAVFGSGMKYGNVVGITLGTGLGGGIAINKKIYHGRNNAAEFGHMTIDFDGWKSRCRNHGCIETHVASRGIARIFGERKDPYAIFKMALEGNKKAAAAYQKMGHYFGIGLTNIIYSMDPDIIVVGGKISNSWELFYRSMNKAVRERYFTKPCPIVKSKLMDAGILGAAALVLER